MRCCRKKNASPTTRTIYPSTTVHFDEHGQAFNPNAQFANNRIRTTKYSIWTFLPLNLWEQFHRLANVYFVFILILNFMPGIDAFAKEVAPIPVILTLAVIAIKDGYEDFRRHLSDRRVNRRTCKVFSLEKACYVDTRWESILPGDFVRLHTNEMIPADVLLLHSSNVAGICHIETANLDGESNLKQRELLDRQCSKEAFSPLSFTFPAEVESPSSELYKFNGKLVRPDRVIPIRKNNMILRGCVLRNTDFIEGMVIYAGSETKSALNNTGPRFKRSKLEHRINLDVAWCVLILAVICFTGAVGCGIWQQNLPGDDVPFVAIDRNASTSSPAFQGFLNFWRFIIIFQSIIPLPLYVSIEFIKMHQVWHMNQDLELYDAAVDRRIEVRAFNIPEDLGQIEYVFSDKTGTLTENKMEFKRASINGIDFFMDSVGSVNDEDGDCLQISKETLVPETRINFDSLKTVVDKMSLLTTGNDGLGDCTDLPPVGTSTPTLRNESLTLSSNHAVIEEFILALTICNTAVVSATKNSASLFQVPNRRRGLKSRLRASPLLPAARRGRVRKKPPSDTSSVKHALSLGSIFTRKRRQNKPETVTAPQFDLAEDICEEQSEQTTVDTPLEDPVTTQESPDVAEASTSTVSPFAVPQLVLPVDMSDQQPLRALGPGHKQTSSQSLPPVVQGLTLDLPTPRPLHGKRIGGKRKKQKACRAVDVLQWRAPFSDPDESMDDFVSRSYVSLDSQNSTPQAPRSKTDAVTLTDGVELRQAESRKFTVVAHDGSVYELPIGDDSVVPATAESTACCPLSDTTLYASYESESPDELSLVKAACRQGCKLLQRGLDFVLIWLPTDGLVGIRVLNILPFDSIRKRMSILIRHPATNDAILYTKGADSAILDRVRCTNVNETRRLETTRMHVDEFSRAGLRTLVVAKRIVPEDELKTWSREYLVAETTAQDSANALQSLMDKIERDFTLLGVTGIEDRLQEGVPETIECLREAGIHVWVLTGDKQETAVNVAHAAHLITDEHKLIYINASSKTRTGYLINCHLHSLLFGHPWPQCDEINDVVSDDPDIDSSSSYSSPSPSLNGLFGTSVDLNHVSTHSNPRHVRVCSPPTQVYDRLQLSNSRLNRRITRSLSESRAPPRRPRRRPRLKKRMHIRNLQRHRTSIESSKLALVIDGETLQFALEEDMKGSFLRLARLCTSVLCCRSTPSQKASVVSLVKKGLSVQTLAIGDGANDVNMIQVADVGVGIGGEEGMQAVMASDFAVSRFRFLRRLVLVHGHLCYDKLAHTALYLFYKDGVYIFLLFWFQLFNGFSGSNAVDQLSQILFSITMTGLPPFLMGIWDNPIDPDTLMQNPVLYRSGIKGKAYRPWLFWINILDAVWQSLIIFFIPYLFHVDSTMTLWRFGVLQMNILVLCALIHAALETRTWVFLHWIGLIFSYLFAWVFFTMVYHALAVTGIAPENPYFVIFVAMNDSTFWLLTVITTVAALLPRLLFITLNNMFNPSLDTVANLMTKKYGRGKRLPLEAYLAGFPVSLSPIKRHSPVGGTSISSGLSHITLPATTPDGLQVQGSSQPSLPSANMEDLETPTHFISRMEQLFSVGGRLFRGVPPSSHLPSTAAPVSPISMINLRQSPGFVVDSRRRRRRTQTINYGYGRPSVRYGTRGSNNFDDEAGPRSTPGIWPAVDPHVRSHSLSGPRHLGHRNRPVIDDEIFFGPHTTLPRVSTRTDLNLLSQTPPSGSSMQVQVDLTPYFSSIEHEDPPPPYYSSGTND
ncbi:hypothetical protein CRM22_010471 [Opisthorchis felineus]|uniref:Uncharacterized protein n=1 Tax=Opisthorchis felineus TaxID=147828 RepID=A0A4V3SC23_OPIFE|nr:hypothetical protein CRM22_010471 [Opisthorchis felineus]